MDLLNVKMGVCVYFFIPPSNAYHFVVHVPLLLLRLFIFLLVLLRIIPCFDNSF